MQLSEARLYGGACAVPADMRDSTIEFEALG